MVTLTRIDEPVFGEIVDVNGNVFVTLNNITGVNKRTDRGLPAALSKNINVYLDDECEYTPKIIKAEYDEISFNGIFEVGRALTRKMIPRNVPYEPDPGTLTDGSYYPCETEYLADVEFGNIRNTFRIGTVTVQLTMVNQSRETLRICKYLKFKLIKKRGKGKNALNNPGRKNIKCGGWVNSVEQMALNLDESTRTAWPHELSQEGDILVIYTSRDASAIQPYITHKQGLGYNVQTQQVSTGTDVQTTVQNAYNANPNIMYVQLVGDWEDIKCAYNSSKYPQDTELGLAAGSDNYLDLSVGRFSAGSATDVTTQVNKAIAWENNLPVHGFMVDGLGIGSPEGTGDDGEYDYQHIDIIKENKLVPNQYVNVDECYQNYTSTCIQNSVNAGVGVINYCGHGGPSGWTSYSSSNVNALTNGSETPFIFSVACNVGDYDGYTCFAEVWLRKTNGGAVAALMSTYSQPWVPPMLGQDYFNDLLTGGYNYSSNPGSGTNTDHGKEILGSIVANGMILWISESSTSSDVTTMKNWTLFGDCALRVFGEAAPPNPPVADFSADTTTVSAGGSIHFTDQSTNSPTSWDWTFEGGTPSGSTAQNPTVTYNTAGTYDVSLTAANSAGSDSETKTNYITVTAPQPPVANFTASSTSISAGDSVTFTDTSTNTPTSWSWTFEGGTPSTSTAQNPTITYNTAGTFDVALTATNAAGSDTETKVDYIDVSETPYCDSSGSSQSYEYIAGVAVADLNNSSGASPYTNFTGYTAHLTQGDSAGVSLTPGFASSSYTEYWRIWIDYNGDHDFEDSGEQVFSGSGSSVVTGSFTVPAAAPLGDTRMRVSMSYSTYPPICGSFSYGEVEDYTANISGVCTQFTLTTNVVGNGSISLNPPGGTYCEGTEVTLTAVPDAGWQFDGWSGDLSGTQNPATITMGSNKNVTATFSQLPVNQYSLTVNTTGQGSVTLNPSGGVYDEGTVVTLTAVPDSGWKFDNWSGDLSGSTNPTTITMNANKTVTANFSETGGCTEIVGYNTVFSLSTTTASRRAMPFTMPENGEICSVTMYHNGGSGSMIMGVYDGESLPNNRLGVTASTPVSGTTGWQTIDLTSPAFVASGAKVWLAWVYESNPGMYYESGSPGRASSSQTWSGGMPDPFGSSTTANYIYSIYANYTPTAPPQYTLTTNVVGNGSIGLNPAGGTYDAGTVVTLTATPDSGWQFDGWSGDLTGSTNPTTITMNSNKTVTATFSEVGPTGTVGITDVYGSNSTSNYRRAMPFTMPENGTITSVTMYHTGGSGSMIMGVYDGSSTPQNRLAVTPTTAVSGSTGWQTINLTGSAYVPGGSTVWLAWVYESNPGIRYQTGSPGRYQSSQSWSGGMPDPFGSGSQTNYVYSIYATYNK
jgi:gingipain R